MRRLIVPLALLAFLGGLTIGAIDDLLSRIPCIDCTKVEKVIPAGTVKGDRLDCCTSVPKTPKPARESPPRVELV